MKHLPKIELHCHLDGSLRTETVFELAKKHHIILPSEVMDELNDHLVAPADCDSLLTYLERFDLPIAITQTEDALERVAYELMEDAANENVKYLEIRFAPQQHTEKGLTQDLVIKSVLDGIKRAEDAFEIKGNLILSYLRHTSPKEMYTMIDAGRPFINKGVVAVDLCGGELEAFSERFVEPVNYARELGYEVTIHAGETGISSNVIDAIKLLGATRIGHGVAIKDNAEAYGLLKSKGVVIESCPTSNVQTKAVLNMDEHPIDDFYKDDLLVMVNTDNRTVSDTTMTKEFERIEEAFHWNESDFNRIFEISIEASYASDEVKDWLKSFLN
ncbi:MULTISPECIES: adenosine deaminase [unclassified Fusibacter]|uniref:adenosine deaminase n=1 Tax=unclassified Fusibacter TaxID=2624464 RepID=UPI00101322B4|nr:MULTISPECIES: adenosine deaminase [unclassified Fusibacter]MCK8060120.1 adenosine deaminase [Fusibacter sp. A2]NPE22262.1 adenosine deaminase [Fusibacter sp. A1]RXV61036.1 adenosine deaminase [Fusibacter sp. A1]